MTLVYLFFSRTLIVFFFYFLTDFRIKFILLFFTMSITLMESFQNSKLKSNFSRANFRTFFKCFSFCFSDLTHKQAKKYVFLHKKSSVITVKTFSTFLVNLVSKKN